MKPTCEHEKYRRGFGWKVCGKPAKFTGRKWSPMFPSTERLNLCGIHAKSSRAGDVRPLIQSSEPQSEKP